MSPDLLVYTISAARFSPRSFVHAIILHGAPNCENGIFRGGVAHNTFIVSYNLGIRS